MASSLRIIFFISLSIFTGKQVNAQQRSGSFSEEINFAKYLQDKEQFSDAVTALDQLSINRLTPFEQDTVYYLKGWSFYNLKALDSSSYYLLKVSSQSENFLKARLFSAYNYTYLHQYDSAALILQTVASDSSLVNEMLHFEQAGISLLKRAYNKYDSLQGKFTFNYYALSAQEKNFGHYKNDLLGEKKRSPVLAGFMSAVVPGTGKIYAGKTYAGIAAILPIAALALLTNEAYHKSGPRSAEFYIFGSALTVFYVGNIWGSVLAVKIKKEDNERLIDQKILFDLQIPLRTIFN